MSGLDHLVLCVADLDNARQRYQALGFTMTPKAQHPFGTGNSNIQLQGCFLEVLTVMAPQDIPEHGPENFSFAAHNRDNLKHGDGFSMLVLQSSDARKDQQRFANAGLRTYQPFDFSRKAKQPGGEEVTVGFSLAFATDPLAPTSSFFTCEQHAPEHFWKTDYQRHDNTAHTVTAVYIVSVEPQAHIPFLEAYTGTSAVVESSGVVTVDTPRGRIMVLSPGQYEDLFHTEQPDVSDGAKLAGYLVGVDDIAVAREVFDQNEVSYVKRDELAFIDRNHTMGVAVVFGQVPR